jgi:hypothetical protein
MYHELLKLLIFHESIDVDLWLEAVVVLIVWLFICISVKHGNSTVFALLSVTFNNIIVLLVVEKGVSGGNHWRTNKHSYLIARYQTSSK